MKIELIAISHNLAVLNYKNTINVLLIFYNLVAFSDQIDITNARMLSTMLSVECGGNRCHHGSILGHSQRRQCHQTRSGGHFPPPAPGLRRCGVRTVLSTSSIVNSLELLEDVMTSFMFSVVSEE